jgi:hypothetical protein
MTSTTASSSKTQIPKFYEFEDDFFLDIPCQTSIKTISAQNYQNPIKNGTMAYSDNLAVNMRKIFSGPIDINSTQISVYPLPLDQLSKNDNKPV